MGAQPLGRTRQQQRLTSVSRPSPGAGEPKELFLIEGATHIDLYDKPQYVGPAVEKLADYFGKYL